MGPNGIGILIPPRHPEGRILGDVLGGRPHDQVAHGVRQTIDEADAGRILLEVEQLGQQREGARGSLPGAFGFSVFEQEVGDGRMVGDGNPAHRFHAEHQHRVGIAAADFQACEMESGDPRSAVFPRHRVGRDRGRQAAGDGRNPGRIDGMRRGRHIAPEHTIDRGQGETPTLTAPDRFTDDPGSEEFRLRLAELSAFPAEGGSKTV